MRLAGLVLMVAVLGCSPAPEPKAPTQQQQAESNPMEPIDKSAWRDVPHMNGQVATEDDVRAGRAAFFFPPNETLASTAAELTTPALGVLRDDGRVVVIIQAEVKVLTVVGIRYFEGGRGMFPLDAVELIDESDPRFTQATEKTTEP